VNLHTDDLFLGALALSRGGYLERVEIHGQNGRRMVVFEIAGADVEDIEQAYYHGDVTVNLRHLKAEVQRLKNVAFDALRREESRDAGQQGRNRSDQGRERYRLGRR
jgi:hypothetical protein